MDSKGPLFLIVRATKAAVSKTSRMPCCVRDELEVLDLRDMSPPFHISYRTNTPRQILSFLETARLLLLRSELVDSCCISSQVQLSSHQKNRNSWAVMVYLWIPLYINENGHKEVQIPWHEHFRRMKG